MHHSIPARQRPTDMAEAAENETGQPSPRGNVWSKGSKRVEAGLFECSGPHPWLFEAA